jgi:hypothetical protein
VKEELEEETQRGNGEEERRRKSIWRSKKKTVKLADRQAYLCWKKKTNLQRPLDFDCLSIKTSVLFSLLTSLSMTQAIPSSYWFSSSPYPPSTGF